MSRGGRNGKEKQSKWEIYPGLMGDGGKRRLNRGDKTQHPPSETTSSLIIMLPKGKDTKTWGGKQVHTTKQQKASTWDNLLDVT